MSLATQLGRLKVSFKAMGPLIARLNLGNYGVSELNVQCLDR